MGNQQGACYRDKSDSGKDQIEQEQPKEAEPKEEELIVAHINNDKKKEDIDSKIQQSFINNNEQDDFELEKIRISQNTDAPKESIATLVQDQKISSLPCKINHVRFTFDKNKLRAPKNYQKSPFHSEFFFYNKKEQLYYCGQWKQGIPHGFGQLILSDHSYYMGYFNNGQANGHCYYISQNGAYYEGNVENSERVATKQTELATLLDGQYKYRGEWVKNLPHGAGSETFKNGDSYEGQFVRGMKQKQGCYRWANGNYKSFKGFFNQNQIFGQGKLQLKDGNEVNGQFSLDSCLQIQNAKFQFNGYSFVCQKISNGQPIGEVTAFKDNHKYTVRNGKLTGIITNNNNPQYIFQNKQLIYFNQSYPHQNIRTILNNIENAYQSNERHSQVLTKLKEQLPSYIIGFWNQQDRNNAVVIVSICGKNIIVKSIQNNDA